MWSTAVPSGACSSNAVQCPRGTVCGRWTSFDTGGGCYPAGVSANRDGGPGHREHAATFAYTHLWSSVVVFTVASMMGPRVVAVVELLRSRRGRGPQRYDLAAVRSHGQ